MPTNLALLQELTLQIEGEFLPLPAEYETDTECYRDDCTELCVLIVRVAGYPGDEGLIQLCEGHARLHYDQEYQALRSKWRLAGWGE